MLLTRLSLLNFRLFTEKSLAFSAGLNTIEGPNACGKTSILEAIHLSTLGHSFRTSRLQELINNPAPTKQAVTHLHYEVHGIEQHLSVVIGLQDRYLRREGGSKSPLKEAIGSMLLAAITPASISVVNGAPHSRREFLDLFLAQIDPYYYHCIQRYQRGLRQRNSLLPNYKQCSAELSCWEHELAHVAAYIINARRQAIVMLSQQAPTVLEEALGITKSFKIKLRDSHTSIREAEAIGDIRTALVTRWQQQRPKEAVWARTLTGPHRDDLVIALDNREARHWASEGERRALIIVLGLMTQAVLAQLKGSSPLLIIDDGFTALDNQRCIRLMRYLAKAGQCILTTPYLPSGVDLSAANLIEL